MAAQIKLPPCGMFFGTPIYLDRGNYIFQTTGPYYTSWVPEDHDVPWYLNKIVTENQGNLAIIWDGGALNRTLSAMSDFLALEDIDAAAPPADWSNNRYLTLDEWEPIAKNLENRYGAGLYKWVKQAKTLGLYVYTIYTDANTQYCHKIVQMDNFLGYNAGEAFSFDIHPEAQEDAGLFREKRDKIGNNYNLEILANGFQKNIQNYFQVRRANGWNRFFVTSASFHLDFEIASGGSDVIPHVEGFAFHNLNFGMALCRGAYKQHNLPLWGCYIAHEHYSFVPYSCKHKFTMLDNSFYLAYLNGSKITVQECGNFFQQSDHVADTLMHQMPKFDAGAIHINNPHDYAHLVPEAQKYYPLIGYNSEVCAKYRKSISDFYNYLKENSTPDGQPEVTFAALKGRFDFCTQTFNPNFPIAGAQNLADRNAAWFESMPERGWELFRKIFYPLHGEIENYQNLFFSGTPYGLSDIVSFAGTITPEFLNKNYRALIMTGWNSATPEQYRILLEYVKNGGILCCAIPHFSTNISRNFVSYQAEELINHGDLSELCGVKVRKRGNPLYWVLAAENNQMQLEKHKRFGAFCTHMGDIEIVGEQVEVLAYQDEQFLPFLLKNRVGKGEVWFINSWEHPGVFDIEWSPSADRRQHGFFEAVTTAIARKVRGNCYITDDGKNVGESCKNISFAYYPSNHKCYILNCDFDTPQKIYLHYNGKMQLLYLKAAEFKIINCGDINKLS